ncbi:MULTISPECIES: SDR family oxidoreductase [Microbacterium]|uniref:SDR family NAD(P)-dependent oxidoreductase n=1 Tax=Microbacterium TaxID=33882 RepID=UPI000D645D49|nr:MULTISPECIES: SDR family oxidoreductase [Microbacterium]
MELEGKIAVVTGGGQGIGRGIVQRFLEEGATVAILQNKPLEDDLAGDDRVLGIDVDLTNVADAAAAIDQVAATLGGIDILVNNAGVSAEWTVAEVQPEQWDFMMAVNLKAPLFLTQAALPHLKRRGGGSIINTGSVEGLASNPFHAVYSSSKAGIHGLTKALAVDLGEFGIRCNAIAPGYILTALTEAYVASLPDPDAAWLNINRIHPVGRIGDPIDIGGLAVYLASDRSTFVSGQVIAVDGARMAKLSAPL